MKIKPYLASLAAIPLLGLSALVDAVPAENDMAPPLERAALISKQADRALVNALALAGERLVAVGARGVILVSDDHGQSWQQVESPVSVTLTAVSFIDASRGWVVGHSGVILHTSDGGATWAKQLDGLQAAQKVKTHVATLIEGLDEEQTWSLEDYAALLVDDGPDKPFLDVLFIDEKCGFVIGAFGMIFHTRDGGKSWEPWFEYLDNPGKLHLYSIRAANDEIVIVGEQGMYLRSDDGGRAFEKIETPYSGSFFTVTPFADGGWLLAGLRGNAFVHDAQRGEFRKLPVQSPVSFNSSMTLENGGALLVNQAGQVFHVVAGAQGLTPLALKPLPPLAGIVEAGDGAIVVTGFRGPVRLAHLLEQKSAGVMQ